MSKSSGNVQQVTERQILAAVGWVAAFVVALVMVTIYFAGRDYFAKNVFPFLIGACAIVFSSLWASWFAYHAIVNQQQTGARAAHTARSTAKLQATLDLILKTELDREFIEAKLRWAHCSKSYTSGIPVLLARAHYGTASPGELKDSTCVRTFFNNFELVALAISQDIIDTHFYQRWQRSSFITIWNSSADAVGVMRALMANDKIYHEWESLVKEWAKDVGRQVAIPPEYSTGSLVKLAGLASKDQKPAVAPAEAEAPKAGDGKPVGLDVDTKNTQT
jgi:hypothetical protein